MNSEKKIIYVGKEFFHEFATSKGHLFMYLFIHVFICLFIYLFIYSFIFIYLFINKQLNT